MEAEWQRYIKALKSAEASDEGRLMPRPDMRKPTGRQCGGSAEV